MNKKLFFLIAFGFILLTNVNAQIRVGGTAGVNVTNFTDFNNPSKKRVGFQAGALAMVPIDTYDMFYIQSGLIYSNQGEYWGAKSNKPKTKYFVNYINIPVLLKIYFSPDENEFFGYVGPQFGFKVSDKIESQYNKDEKIKSFDFSGTVGIGFSLNRDWEVFAQYNYGFTDNIDNDRLDKTNRNSNLSFGISYFFY